MTEKLKGWGAITVSVLIFLVLAWWLIVVAAHLGDSPTVANGAVTLDTFQRSKDILLVILPLTTTAVGFWLGNQGADKAEQSAQQAIQDAHHADAVATSSQELMHDHRERALLAEQKLSIILTAARSGRPDLAPVVYAVLEQELADSDSPTPSAADATPAEPRRTVPRPRPTRRQT